MTVKLEIRTPGFWPLPKFVKAHTNKGWIDLQLVRREEKLGEYEMPDARFEKTAILECEICKALPKKIVLTTGKQRRVLSRWIGGIYSDVDTRAVKRMREFYNSITPIYNYHTEPGRLDQLKAFVHLFKNGSKVLDASAGDCRLNLAVIQSGKKITMQNSDVSEGMLSLRDKLIPKKSITVASASKLPFENQSFDCVAHTFSNIHALDKKFFKEFYRVLKPGGFLLYHPVKSPGEQWPKNFVQKTFFALKNAGFSKVKRKSTNSTGNRKTVMVYYKAEKE